MTTWLNAPIQMQFRVIVRAVHPEPALHLRQPQPEPSLPLQRSVKVRPQRRDLHVLRLRYGAKPRVRRTKPRGIITHRLIGHARRLPQPTAPIK